jgi:hypothetical protein
MKDTSNSKTLNLSSSAIGIFSGKMMTFEEMGESGRRVFSLSNRNACVLEPGVGLYVFHL